MAVIRKAALSFKCGNFAKRYPDHEANDLLGEAEGLIDEMESELEELRAALTPQWQPISSAPRDGTYFLALTGRGFQRVDKKHQEVPASLFWNERPLDRYTHWMPLPAAPEVGNG